MKIYKIYRWDSWNSTEQDVVFATSLHKAACYAVKFRKEQDLEDYERLGHTVTTIKEAFEYEYFDEYHDGQRIVEVADFEIRCGTIYIEELEAI